LKTICQAIAAIFLSIASFAIQPMSLTVSPVLVDHKISLSQALAQIGMRVQGGYVLFGIDIRTVTEPEVELKIPDPTPLGIALADVVGQVEGYGYRLVSEHVIEVCPIRESLDPTDALNLRVGDFSVANTPAADIFSKPARFIPELRNYLLQGKVVQACGSIGPGFGSAGPGIKLELRNVTVREVLDAVAEADATLQAHSDTHTLPVGWVHKEALDKEGHVVNTWSFLASVPHSWDRSLAKHR
jgi:hypothetical protein